MVLSVIATSLAWITAVIYTYSCKMAPKKITWPQLGLTALLWTAAVYFTTRIYVLGFLTQLSVHETYVWATVTFVVSIVGYVLFLIGTFKTGPVFSKR